MDIAATLMSAFSKFIEKTPTTNSVLDREKKFLPIYRNFITHLKADDLDDKSILQMLPNFIESYQTPRFRVSHQRRLNRLIEAMKPKHNTRILDVGCEFGTNLLELSAMGAECYGVELQPSPASVFNIRIHALNVKAHVIVADASHLPFKNGCFDVVMARESLSHVARLAESLDEMSRVSLTVD